MWKTRLSLWSLNRQQKPCRCLTVVRSVGMDLSLIEDSGMDAGLSPENDNDTDKGFNHSETWTLVLHRRMW